MRLSIATALLAVRYTPAQAQTCATAGVTGPFTLSDITGNCTHDKLLAEYTLQVFDVTGSTCVANTLTAQEDFDAKLELAKPGLSAMEAADAICKDMYDAAIVTSFTEAADKGTDHHFEKMFYNGRGEWQEEIETIYETDDRSPSSRLREDAQKVREFYRGDGSYSRVSWPDELTNFAEPSCSSKAAMCCWPKDRQANDGNGNCATPYDENCVNKDPGDNTNLCFADFAKGGLSSGFDSDQGFAVFPEDGSKGEGSIHCHGFAWADDDYDSISRYKANNLFFVSMYDHMHQRGYVENIPGMPMCACMDQMPLATRSDCTQVDVTEDWEVTFDDQTSSMVGHITKADIEFNACRGRGNRNNDLWAYAARLYDEGRTTAEQFGKVGRVLTNDSECYHATENAKAEKGFTTAYDHDPSEWTQVAGREELYAGAPMGREAFNVAFFEHSVTKPSDLSVAEFAAGETPIVMRICATCVSTHRKIFYRRLTPVPDGHNIMNFLTQRRTSSAPVGGTWGTDFTLHSTYEDAKSGANPWECGSGGTVFNYHATFVGDCYPTTRVTSQWSQFTDFLGPRLNVAFYINTPEGEGVEKLDLTSRAVGTMDVDVGEPKLAGHTYTSEGGTVYHVSGAGNDIWGYRDQFHFNSQPASGDIDVRVHLTEFTNPGSRSYNKAGIMLRSDNSNDATYAFGHLTGTQGIYLQHRRSKGMHAATTAGYKASPTQTDSWLRIVKKEETIEFYRGDGQGGWILTATDTIFFPNDSFRVGLAVCSTDVNHVAEATFKDYEIAAYNAPTIAPTMSDMPTVWTPLIEIDTQRAGEFYESNGVDVLKGSGTGIWGTADSMAFYNTQHADVDFSVTAYIKRFYNSQKYARGGIMIRDSNDSGAVNAFVGGAGNYQGAVFTSREAAGEETTHHKMVWTNNDNKHWVKLQKAGATVTAMYRLQANDEWIVLGSVDLALTSGVVQVGMAVTAGRDYLYALETMETQNYQVVDVDPSFPSAAPTTTMAPTSGLIDLTALVGTGAATQSSTCHGGVADRAIDGKPRYDWHGGGVTHTCTDNNPFWQVDMQTNSTAVNTVTVYNRADCCQSRMSNAIIIVLDKDSEEVAREPFVGSLNVYNFNFGNVVGRYIRIEKSTRGEFSIAEVKVRGFLV